MRHHHFTGATLFDAGWTKWRAAQAANQERDFPRALELYRAASQHFNESNDYNAPYYRGECRKAIAWLENRLGIAPRVAAPIAKTEPEMGAAELLESIRADHAAPVDAESEQRKAVGR